METVSRLADLLDRFINWVAPLPPEFDGAEWLADVEADHDHLLPDDLWAAMNLPATPFPRGGGGTTRTPLRVVQPADTTTASGVGGHQLSERDYINALVEDYREFITDCFRKRGR